jgi:hypothetical protein
MIPRKKAEELFDKFLKTDEVCKHSYVGNLVARECAKIAVNEIIASIPTQPSTGELERVDATMFWINVGQEIDKL